MPKFTIYIVRKNILTKKFKSDCLPTLLLDFVYSSLILGDSQGEQILSELVDALLVTEASNQRQFVRFGSLLATIALDRQSIAVQAK